MSTFLVIMNEYTVLAILLTCLLVAVETITVKANLALTMEGTQSIETFGTDVTWR